MEERSIVILLNLVMMALTALVLPYANTSLGIAPFNFYSSNLSLNGRTVIETLHFLPDQSYHTLFRTFASQVANSGNNTVSVSSVRCSAGTPYYRTYSGACYAFQSGQATSTCLPNTENNEYGCTFGNYRGFHPGTDYSISATYTLNPANLFLINGKYYVKFVAYSANNHVDLKSGVNFLVNGGVTGSEFQPTQDVLVYILYNGSTQGFNIKNQTGFGFGYGAPDFSFFIFLFPLILFDVVWLFLGREKKEPPPPSQLSDLPNDRKPWEVSAYFNPPFMTVGRNFHATLMLDFYRRKIVDIKYVDAGILSKKTFVKINKGPYDLDDIEKKYLDFLQDIGKSVPDKDRDGDYFNVNKAAHDFSTRTELSDDLLAITQSVKYKGTPFIDTKGSNVFWGLMLLLLLAGIYSHVTPLSISSIMMLLVSAVVSLRIPLLIRYKQDFYEEYRQWAAFKHGLSHLASVKSSRADAIVQWEKYLVYATALGVADEVLKQLKSLNMVDTDRLNTYHGVYIGSASFSSYVSAGGGGGGVGGGGVGGGGGGGR